MHNFSFSRYSELHARATELLKLFNAFSGTSYVAAPPEEFQARIVRYEKSQNLPATDDTYILAELLLPKILSDTSDAAIMRRILEWMNSLASKPDVQAD